MVQPNPETSTLRAQQNDGSQVYKVSIDFVTPLTSPLQYQRHALPYSYEYTLPVLGFEYKYHAHLVIL